MRRSVRAVTNEDGAVVAQYDYDPYSKPRLTWDSGELDPLTYQPIQFDFLFTGHMYHAKSGLDFAPFRAYDPELGRWISRDPKDTNGGINLYEHVGGHPVNAVDPDGLERLVLQSDTEFGFIQEFADYREANNDPIGHAIAILTPQVIAATQVASAAVAAIVCSELQKPLSYIPVGRVAKVGGMVLGKAASKAGGLFKSFFRKAPAPITAGKPFAMGLTKEGNLEAFAEARGATTWKQLPDPANWREGVFGEAGGPQHPRSLQFEWCGL